MHRRRFLGAVTAAGGAAVAGCGALQSDGSSERDGAVLLETQVAAASDGNPATVDVDAAAGDVLTVDLTYDEPTVFELSHTESGRSLAVGGRGVVHGQSSTAESAPLPDSGGPDRLYVGMHPGASVDVTVSRVGSGEPASPASSGDLRQQVGAVAAGVERADAAAGYELLGPLWLKLYDEKLRALPPETGAEQVRSDALAEATTAVYGGLAGQQAQRWVDGSSESLAAAITSVSLAAVSAKTGLPAGLLEDTVRDEVEGLLQGDRVTWAFEEPVPRGLEVTGGELELVATVTLDLAVEGVGVTVDAPLRLRTGIDAAEPPADAEILDWELLADGVQID